jgi:hypothetical protein
VAAVLVGSRFYLEFRAFLFYSQPGKQYFSGLHFKRCSIFFKKIF